jgi:hypothetical protein
MYQKYELKVLVKGTINTGTFFLDPNSMEFDKTQIYF